jgi:hypothetical protein
MIYCEATAWWVSLIWSFGLWWSNHMPIKPLAIKATKECDLIDLMRARHIERSWAPFFLKPLSSAEVEIVTRAIAHGIAEGRKQGLELAKASNCCPSQAHLRTIAKDAR